MATAQANAAAPLDQLLVDVGAGPLRCWLPGRPGVEFIASLAGKPRMVGRRLLTMVDEVIGGDSRFILSTSGHIAAIVNPPGNPKASYRGGDEKLADAGQWMQTSSTRTGQPVGRLRRLSHRARRSAEAEPRPNSALPGWLRWPTRPAPISSRAEISLAKTGKDLVTMSETPITQQAEAQRIRNLNQQVLARASAAGMGAVDGYEKALQDMADFETKIAGSSQLDWLQAVARSHTKFVTDLVSMYANAISSGLSG